MENACFYLCISSFASVRVDLSPLMSPWHSARLIRHRDKFTFKKIMFSLAKVTATCAVVTPSPTAVGRQPGVRIWSHRPATQQRRLRADQTS
jgi:hypothetical protein